LRYRRQVPECGIGRDKGSKVVGQMLGKALRTRVRLGTGYAKSSVHANLLGPLAGSAGAKFTLIIFTRLGGLVVFRVITTR
jgi:hypothetical protein